MTVGRSTSPTHQIGQLAEEYAWQFLEKRGCVLIGQNYHCPWGEIDLIVCLQQTLIFVEVRARRSGLFGGGAGSITIAKQRRLVRTAAHFLQQFPEYADLDCRFDVITMPSSADAEIALRHLEWIPAAFEAQSD